MKFRESVLKRELIINNQEEAFQLLIKKLALNDEDILNREILSEDDEWIRLEVEAVNHKELEIKFKENTIKMIFDFEKATVKLDGIEFKVEDNREYTYKFSRKTIKAIDGIEGYYRYIAKNIKDYMVYMQLEVIIEKYNKKKVA